MTASKSVLMLLTNNFVNDSRVLKEATSLIKFGYNVKILCFGDDILPQNEIYQDIHVQRMFFSRSSIPFLPFIKTLKKIGYLIKFSILSLMYSREVSIIHCHDLHTLPTAVLIKWFSLGKKKIIYDSHEYQTEVGFHVRGVIKKIYQITEKLFIKQADAVITVSDSIADEYQRLYAIKKPHVILNCPPYQDVTSSKNFFREKFSISEDKIIFLYQGGLVSSRGLEKILEVFSQLQGQDKVLVVMGYGPLEDKVKEYATSYPNKIFFHEAVNSQVLLEYTSCADVGVLCYENTCLNHYYCSPNKFFEYTMAGIPIVISDLYEMKKIISTFQNGIVVSDDINELKDQIKAINQNAIANLRRNISEMKKIYSWEEQEKILYSIYKKI